MTTMTKHISLVLLSLAAVVGVVSASILEQNDSTISTNSVAGRQLMRHARRIDDTTGNVIPTFLSFDDHRRQLNNNNNNDYYDQHDWISGYSIRFETCHELAQFDRDVMRNQLLIKFKLCPSDKCTANCNGPSYVVEAQEFVKSYQKAKMNLWEYKCELQKESCQTECEAQNNYYEYGNRNLGNAGGYYNGNYYDCETMCMIDQGHYDCINDGKNQNGQNNNKNNGQIEEDDLEKYMECRELEGGQNKNENNGGNGYYQQQQQKQYYVGAYCANSGRSIYLGVFQDESCSTKAPSGTYESLNYYGNSLPYSKQTGQSIVSSDCLSCKEQQNRNNGNYYEQDADEIAEVCEQLYEDSLKCEQGMSSSVVAYPNTNGCNFINNALSKMEKASSAATNRSYSRRGDTTKSQVFMWIFFFTSCALAGYVYILLKQKKDTQNALLGSVGGDGDYGNGRTMT